MQTKSGVAAEGRMRAPRLENLRPHETHTLSQFGNVSIDGSSRRRASVSDASSVPAHERHGVWRPPLLSDRLTVGTPQQHHVVRVNAPAIPAVDQRASSGDTSTNQGAFVAAVVSVQGHHDHRQHASSSSYSRTSSSMALSPSLQGVLRAAADSASRVTTHAVVGHATFEGVAAPTRSFDPASTRALMDTSAPRPGTGPSHPHSSTPQERRQMPLGGTYPALGAPESMAPLQIDATVGQHAPVPVPHVLAAPPSQGTPRAPPLSGRSSSSGGSGLLAEALRVFAQLQRGGGPEAGPGLGFGTPARAQSPPNSGGGASGDVAFTSGMDNTGAGVTSGRDPSGGAHSTPLRLEKISGQPQRPLEASTAPHNPGRETPGAGAHAGQVPVPQRGSTRTPGPSALLGTTHPPLTIRSLLQQHVSGSPASSSPAYTDNGGPHAPPAAEGAAASSQQPPSLPTSCDADEVEAAASGRTPPFNSPAAPPPSVAPSPVPTTFAQGAPSYVPDIGSLGAPDFGSPGALVRRTLAAQLTRAEEYKAQLRSDVEQSLRRLSEYEALLLPPPTTAARHSDAPSPARPGVQVAPHSAPATPRATGASLPSRDSTSAPEAFRATAPGWAGALGREGLARVEHQGLQGSQPPAPQQHSLVSVSLLQQQQQQAPRQQQQRHPQQQAPSARGASTAFYSGPLYSGPPAAVDFFGAGAPGGAAPFSTAAAGRGRGEGAAAGPRAAPFEDGEWEGEEGGNAASGVQGLPLYRGARITSSASDQVLPLRSRRGRTEGWGQQPEHGFTRYQRAPAPHQLPAPHQMPPPLGSELRPFHFFGETAGEGDPRDSGPRGRAVTSSAAAAALVEVGEPRSSGPIPTARSAAADSENGGGFGGPGLGASGSDPFLTSYTPGGGGGPAASLPATAVSTPLLHSAQRGLQQQPSRYPSAAVVPAAQLSPLPPTTPHWADYGGDSAAAPLPSGPDHGSAGTRGSGDAPEMGAVLAQQAPLSRRLSPQAHAPPLPSGPPSLASAPGASPTQGAAAAAGAVGFRGEGGSGGSPVTAAEAGAPSRPSRHSPTALGGRAGSVPQSREPPDWGQGVPGPTGLSLGPAAPLGQALGGRAYAASGGDRRQMMPLLPGPRHTTTAAATGAPPSPEAPGRHRSSPLNNSTTSMYLNQQPSPTGGLSVPLTRSPAPSSPPHSRLPSNSPSRPGLSQQQQQQQHGMGLRGRMAGAGAASGRRADASGRGPRGPAVGAAGWNSGSSSEGEEEDEEGEQWGGDQGADTGGWRRDGHLRAGRVPHPGPVPPQHQQRGSQRLLYPPLQQLTERWGLGQQRQRPLPLFPEHQDWRGPLPHTHPQQQHQQQHPQQQPQQLASGTGGGDEGQYESLEDEEEEEGAGRGVAYAVGRTLENAAAAAAGAGAGGGTTGYDVFHNNNWPTRPRLTAPRDQLLQPTTHTAQAAPRQRVPRSRGHPNPHPQPPPSGTGPEDRTAGGGGSLFVDNEEDSGEDGGYYGVRRGTGSSRYLPDAELLAAMNRMAAQAARRVPTPLSRRVNSPHGAGSGSSPNRDGPTGVVVEPRGAHPYATYAPAPGSPQSPAPLGGWAPGDGASHLRGGTAAVSSVTAAIRAAVAPLGTSPTPGSRAASVSPLGLRPAPPHDSAAAAAAAAAAAGLYGWRGSGPTAAAAAAAAPASRSPSPQRRTAAAAAEQPSHPNYSMSLANRGTRVAEGPPPASAAPAPSHGGSPPQSFGSSLPHGAPDDVEAAAAAAALSAGANAALAGAGAPPSRSPLGSPTSHQERQAQARHHYQQQEAEEGRQAAALQARMRPLLPTRHSLAAPVPRVGTRTPGEGAGQARLPPPPPPQTAVVFLPPSATEAAAASAARREGAAAAPWGVDLDGTAARDERAAASSSPVPRRHSRNYPSSGPGTHRGADYEDDETGGDEFGGEYPPPLPLTRSITPALGPGSSAPSARSFTAPLPGSPSASSFILNPRYLEEVTVLELQRAHPRRVMAAIRAMASTYAAGAAAITAAAAGGGVGAAGGGSPRIQGTPRGDSALFSFLRELQGQGRGRHGGAEPLAQPQQQRQGLLAHESDLGGTRSSIGGDGDSGEEEEEGRGSDGVATAVGEEGDGGGALGAAYRNRDTAGGGEGAGPTAADPISALPHAANSPDSLDPYHPPSELGWLGQGTGEAEGGLRSPLQQQPLQLPLAASSPESRPPPTAAADATAPHAPSTYTPLDVAGGSPPAAGTPPQGNPFDTTLHGYTSPPSPDPPHQEWQQQQPESHHGNTHPLPFPQNGAPTTSLSPLQPTGSVDGAAVQGGAVRDQGTQRLEDEVLDLRARLAIAHQEALESRAAAAAAAAQGGGLLQHARAGLAEAELQATQQREQQQRVMEAQYQQLQQQATQREEQQRGCEAAAVSAALAAQKAELDGVYAAAARSLLGELEAERAAAGSLMRELEVTRARAEAAEAALAVPPTLPPGAADAVSLLCHRLERLAREQLRIVGDGGSAGVTGEGGLELAGERKGEIRNPPSSASSPTSASSDGDDDGIEADEGLLFRGELARADAALQSLEHELLASRERITQLEEEEEAHAANRRDRAVAEALEAAAAAAVAAAAAAAGLAAGEETELNRRSATEAAATTAAGLTEIDAELRATERAQAHADASAAHTSSELARTRAELALTREEASQRDAEWEAALKRQRREADYELRALGAERDALARERGELRESLIELSAVAGPLIERAAAAAGGGGGDAGRGAEVAAVGDAAELRALRAAVIELQSLLREKSAEAEAATEAAMQAAAAAEAVEAFHREFVLSTTSTQAALTLRASAASGPPADFSSDVLSATIPAWARGQVGQPLEAAPSLPAPHDDVAAFVTPTAAGPPLPPSAATASGHHPSNTSILPQYGHPASVGSQSPPASGHPPTTTTSLPDGSTHIDTSALAAARQHATRRGRSRRSASLLAAATAATDSQAGGGGVDDGAAALAASRLPTPSVGQLPLPLPLLQTPRHPSGSGSPQLPDEADKGSHYQRPPPTPETPLQAPSAAFSGSLLASGPSSPPPVSPPPRLGGERATPLLSPARHWMAAQQRREEMQSQNHKDPHSTDHAGQAGRPGAGEGINGAGAHPAPLPTPGRLSSAGGRELGPSRGSSAVGTGSIGGGASTKGAASSTFGRRRGSGTAAQQQQPTNGGASTTHNDPQSRRDQQPHRDVPLPRGRGSAPGVEAEPPRASAAQTPAASKPPRSGSHAADRPRIAHPQQQQRQNNGRPVASHHPSPAVLAYSEVAIGALQGMAAESSASALTTLLDIAVEAGMADEDIAELLLGRGGE